jgi:hypothetical protein
MQLLIEGIIINYRGIQALNHDPYGSNIGGNDAIEGWPWESMIMTVASTAMEPLISGQPPF